MSEILAYYLAIFAKPIAQMTIIDLLSLAALPLCFVAALALFFVALGKVIEFFEWDWPEKTKTQRAVMIGSAAVVAILVFGAL